MRALNGECTESARSPQGYLQTLLLSATCCHEDSYAPAYYALCYVLFATCLISTRFSEDKALEPKERLGSAAQQDDLNARVYCVFTCVQCADLW